jgi:hypothetical protein
MSVTPERFVEELDAEVRTALARIADASAATEPASELRVADLLVVALKNELEAAEEAALWLVSEKDLDVKLALMRQCGDEAKHYRLVHDRLRALGVPASSLDPLAGGYGPMFRYLEGLETTVERLAAGPFTREALAQAKNEVFIAWCEAKGDAETARLYRDVVQPDERWHHELGRRLLPRFATTDEARDRARRASRRVLELAEEMQEIARLRKGIARAPGC